MPQDSGNEKFPQEIQEIQETPKKTEDEIFQKIDVSFLSLEENVLWHSSGWVKYLEISKSSLRTFTIANLVAVLFSAFIMILGFNYTRGEQKYLLIIGASLVMYVAIVLIPYLGQGLLCAFSPFAFIPIIKYKKNFTDEELNPYFSYIFLTSMNLISKSIKYPTKKWSFYQKEHLTVEKDRVSCPLNKIEHIIIEARYLSDFKMQIIGDNTKFEEGKPSNLYQLQKLKLSSEQLTTFLHLLYELKKDHQFTIEMKGTDERWIYLLLLVIMVLVPFFKFLINL
jgi:hypothetical protein